MQSLDGKPLRQDVVRNRASLLAAARAVFEEHGIDVPLQLVADAAGLSRASLARHFASRDELVAALWESDVLEIEAKASAVAHEPDSFVRLFDFILEMQVDRRAIRPTASQVASGKLDEILVRLSQTITLALAASQRSGVVRPELTTRSALLAIDMCATAITVAPERSARLEAWRDARALILPGLVEPR